MLMQQLEYTAALINRPRVTVLTTVAWPVLTTVAWPLAE
jgi:hypothetical protein